MSISENLKSVLEQIENSKSVDAVTLVAVSKYSDYSAIDEAYACGQRDFGENRIDSLLPKSQEALDRGHTVNWHFIGNIQSNKIKEISAISGLVAIHSIDSIKHLKKFYECIKTPVKFFIQINTSDEEQKGGLTSHEQINEFLNVIKDNGNSPLKFAGFMTMGKLRADDIEKEAALCFEKLVAFRNKIDESLELSMGMSSDYKIALEYGAKYIRVGSSIFK